MSSSHSSSYGSGLGGSASRECSCVHFDYAALEKATERFNPEKVSKGGAMLGEGGFGPVFLGNLCNTEVAIKVLRRVPVGDKGASDLATEQFEAEIKVLSWFRHPNLVTLMGYSATPGRPRCLVYEYITNGTLEDALEFGVEREGNKEVGLPWMARISIAQDAARGLSYLHTAVKGSPLVHRDVKSANVLLDLSFRAKVGDFGLARTIGAQEGKLQTARVVGTSGYIAPEYFRGTITTKLDTYAFGVILLELMTGLPSYDERRLYTDVISHVDIELKAGKPLFVLIDKRAGNWPSESFSLLYEISNECLEDKLSRRLEMTEVYKKLDDLVSMSTKLYARDTMYVQKYKETTEQQLKSLTRS